MSTFKITNLDAILVIIMAGVIQTPAIVVIIKLFLFFLLFLKLVFFLLVSMADVIVESLLISVALELMLVLMVPVMMMVHYVEVGTSDKGMHQVGSRWDDK